MFNLILGLSMWSWIVVRHEEQMAVVNFLYTSFQVTLTGQVAQDANTSL